MGSVTAQLLDELGYDPDDGVPEVSEVGDVGEVAGGGRTDCLRIGSVMAARIGARRVAVARLGSGRLVVVDDVCPHDGGRISDGFVDGELLVCARHGWELAPRNGRCERACKLRE
jgi:nitrite reductase/ring-hydroxylating ferredoxin subunit